jgi:hypothetical protein
MLMLLPAIAMPQFALPIVTALVHSLAKRQLMLHLLLQNLLHSREFASTTKIMTVLVPPMVQSATSKISLITRSSAVNAQVTYAFPSTAHAMKVASTKVTSACSAQITKALVNSECLLTFQLYLKVQQPSESK